MTQPRIPLGLDVRDLKLVQAVAEQGSLTKAGLTLYLTQSALSHQLADLERRVGAPLFSRLGKRMVLSPAGERLRDSARPILASIAHAEEELQATVAEREGLIRLSTECYTCYHWLPPVLKTFHSVYPKVEARVVVAGTRRPVAALLKGLLDVAILHTPTRERRVRLTPLFRDELVAVTALEHPWAQRPFVVPQDFRPEHLLLLSPPSESSFYQEVLVPAGVTPRRAWEVHLTEAVVELVKAGLGVGVLARWAVAPHVQSGALRAVRITRGGIHRQWSAAVLRQNAAPRYLQAFVNLLRCERDGCPAAVRALEYQPGRRAKARIA